jgi:hypothetical protein
MVREVHFAWDGDNGVETTLVRAADCRLSETHDWDLGEFADAIPLTAPRQSARPETEGEGPDELQSPVQSEGRRRRRRSSDDPKRHLAGANWLAYMPAPGTPSVEKVKAPQQADAGR